jgi:FkbM family methyltransferase
MLGLNDPFIADERNLGKFSYLRKFSNQETWDLIDCGSHQGKFAEGASKHLNLNSVMFIDANSDYNDLLREKFPHSTILNRAISLEREDLYYIRNPRNPGQNYVSDSVFSAEKVNTISLTEVINSKVKVPKVKTFLKIDIEGNEVDVLKSVPRSLLSTLSVISLEITPNSAGNDFFEKLDAFIPEEFQFFRERRFGLVQIDRRSPHWTDKLNLFQNLILVNKNHLF